MTGDRDTEAAMRCLPPTWPRPPQHPVPEEEPSSLDERVDWMTYSHPQLYDMVHSGLDLSGAMSVSAKWARLGDELADIGQELAKLLYTTAQAWEGESAELAKGSVSALADWSSRSGALATEVCACITVQVDNAATARNAMPAPLHALPMPHPTPMPRPVPRPVPQSVVPSQASAFTSGDFGTAAPLVSDSMIYSSQERALHQQAAQAMETFQQNSRDVYSTVPQFAPPDLTRMPYGPPPEPPQPPLPPQPQPPTPQPPLPVPGPPVGGGRGVQSGPGGGGASGGPGRTATPLGAGPGSGAAPTEQKGTRPAAAATARGTGAPGHGPMGGMPMGGAGAQGGEDAERKGKAYLKEDEDIWGLDDQRVMPPVIGEVNRRA